MKIRTNPENISDNAEEGVFLTKVFDYFVDFFQRYRDDYPRCSLSSFLKVDFENAIKRKECEELISNLTVDNFMQDIGFSLSKHLVSRIFNLNDYNPNSKMVLSTKEDMLFANKYIIYVLKKVPLLINIDNIQNIDSYSFKLLTDWIISSARKSLFLFEYTVSETNSSEKLLKYIKHFESLDLDSKLIPLNGLDPDDALMAIKNIHQGHADKTKLFEDAKKYYVSHGKGSMQKLIDYTLQYSSNSSLSNCYDPTLERINLLGNAEKFILSLIIIHSGEIDNTLLEFFSEISINPIIINYSKTIDILEKEQFINRNIESQISIAHASLIDSWNNNPKKFDKYNLLAFELCEKHYLKYFDCEYQIADKESIDQAMLFLLRTYAKYSPAKLEKLILKTNSLVSERITPESIWEYYLIFLDYIKGNEFIHKSSLYDMVFFCFNHAMYKQCLYIIQLLEDISNAFDKEFLFVYKINCFEYLEVENAIQLCEDYLSDLDSDEQKYNCYLLLMGRYRSQNKMEQVMRCVAQIKQIPNYMNMQQYGIFLRLSEIYMSRKDALPYVQQSVEFYMKANNEYMEAKSRLTLFFLLALTSDLTKAHNELEHCKKLVAPMHYWESILALNEASLLLLQNQYGQEVDKLLRKAELSITGSFDLLLTLTMKLINQCESSPDSISKTLLTRIQQLLRNETDQHLVCLVAYNLYIYYMQIEKTELSNTYLKLAIETQQYNTTISYHLRHEMNPNTPNLFKTKWGIGFTFFWNVDIPKPYL
ncbi:MAG: hypothetical protein IKT40_05530 [Bacilli bacterium]|nr:hypothetical protein [Bacilli bacterium]